MSSVKVRLAAGSLVAALVAVVAGVFIWHALASSCLAVPDDGLIQAPGRYCLKDDLETDRGIGIEIVSSDVYLDLDGHTVASRGAAVPSFGVLLRETGISNIAVTNGIIRDFVIGVHVLGARNFRIRGLRVIHAGSIGINLLAEDARVSSTSVSDVEGTPVRANYAYSVGINLGGANIVVEDVAVEEVYRQDLDSKVGGEGIGILISAGCNVCSVLRSSIQNSRASRKTIGLWLASQSRALTAENRVTSFERGLLSFSPDVVMWQNEIVCGDSFEESIGIAHPDIGDGNRDLTIRHDNSVLDCTNPFRQGGGRPN